MLLGILIGVLLILHGLIHGVLAVMPNPNATKPVAATFFSERANPWLRGTLSSRALQATAIVLAAGAGAGFISAGLAMFGFLLPHDWWRALAIASSVVSLMLCALFLAYLPHRGAGDRRWHHRGGRHSSMASGSRPRILEAGIPNRKTVREASSA
jgi:hypothetical protein